MQRDIRALTGVRGVAACLVVFYHFSWGGVGRGPVLNFTRHGYLAVDLFFVLSGFVMAMTYGGLFEYRCDVTQYLRFLAKRLGRVYPLYIAVTLAMLVLGGAGVVPNWGLFTPGTIASNVLLVQSWGLGSTIDGPGWSISTEWAAYLLLPLLCSACLSGSAGRATWAGVAAVAALIWLSSRSTAFLASYPRHGALDIFNGHYPWPLLRCIAEFCIGLLAWRVSGVPRYRRLASHRWACDATAVLILLLLATRGTDVLLVGLFAVLVVTLAVASSPTARLLGTRPIHWLGTISYSVYLVHFPLQDFRTAFSNALQALGTPHSFTAGSVLLLGVTVGAASLTYYGIEEPGRRLSRRWIGRGAPVLPVGSDAVRMT